MIESQNIFTARLSGLLKTKGWSFSKLGKKTGIANSSFTRWKLGVMPELSSVQKIANALAVEVASLIEGTDLADKKELAKPADERAFKSSKANNHLTSTNDPDSTDTKDDLISTIMVTLQSSHAQRRNRVEQTLKEIASRLLQIPEASPKMKQALRAQISARIKEYEKLCELETNEKNPHN